MSRSYKKTPIFSQKRGSKWVRFHKRSASKKVRRTLAIPNGCWYKKCYLNSRDIVEYRTYQSRGMALCVVGGKRKQFENGTFRLWRYGAVVTDETQFTKYVSMDNWYKWQYRK